MYLLIYYSQRYTHSGLCCSFHVVFLLCARHKKNWVRVRNILMLIIIINIRHTNSNMFISIRAAVLYFSRHCRPFITNQQPAIHRRNKVAQRTPSEVERVKGLIYGIPKPKIWGRVLKSFHVFIVQPHFQTRRERLLPLNRTF